MAFAETSGTPLIVCHPGLDRLLDGEISHRVCTLTPLPLLIRSASESVSIAASLMDITGATNGRSLAPEIPQPNPAVIHTAITQMMDNAWCLLIMESESTKRAA